MNILAAGGASNFDAGSRSSIFTFFPVFLATDGTCGGPAACLVYREPGSKSRNDVAVIIATSNKNLFGTAVTKIKTKTQTKTKTNSKL